MDGLAACICVRPPATWQLVALVAMVPFRGDRSPKGRGTPFFAKKI